jgi:hypothetical protein
MRYAYTTSRQAEYTEKCFLCICILIHVHHKYSLWKDLKLEYTLFYGRFPKHITSEAQYTTSIHVHPDTIHLPWYQNKIGRKEKFDQVFKQFLPLVKMFDVFRFARGKTCHMSYVSRIRNRVLFFANIKKTLVTVCACISNTPEYIFPYGISEFGIQFVPLVDGGTVPPSKMGK